MVFFFNFDHHLPLMTVEETLRRAEDMAALLRYVGLVAAVADEKPDPQAFNGLHDVADEITELVAMARESLSVNARRAEARRRHAA